MLSHKGSGIGFVWKLWMQKLVRSVSCAAKSHSAFREIVNVQSDLKGEIHIPLVEKID